MQFVNIKNDIAFRKISSTWTKAELDAYNYAAMRTQDDRGKIQKAKEIATSEKAIEVAKKALEKGYPIQDIVEISGLTIEEVSAIKAKIV